MARVAVTGASGFIGSHVVARLHERGHQVVATGRDLRRLQALQAPCERVLSLDLAEDELEPLLEGCDALVHCAALSSPWGPAAQFWRSNVLATERLLEASTRAGIGRFIHLGSPSIYFRFADQFHLGEDFQPPARWITEYARSKWESELRVRAAAARGLPCLVLRPRAVFGERDAAILPRILAVAERGWFPLVAGGRAVIDVTYVGNLATLVADSLDADVRCDGRAYNVSNGRPIALGAMLQRLFDSLGREVRLLPLPRTLALAAAGTAEAIARLRPGQPEPRLTRYGVGVIGYSQTLDISRAQRELGYAPTVSVQEGLDRFVAWWTSDARH